MYNYHGKLQISVHKNGRNNQTLKWDKAIPCWSVGRLIEIYVLCTGEEPIALHWMGDYLESFVKMFEIRVGTKELDFSKLA